MKTWRCNLKKKRILQDENLELWFKRNELTYKCWYKWPMKTLLILDFWVMHTWGKHHREFWVFYIFHFITQTWPTLQPISKDLLEALLIVGISYTLTIFSLELKKEKCLKLSNPIGWFVQGRNFSNSQILKWLKRNFKLGALSLFSPNNVIHKYYHISFLDCLWRLNLTMFKRKKQILITWV